MELFFEAIAIKNNIAYAADFNENAMFKVDMQTKGCDYICEFEGEALGEKRMFAKAFWIDNLIYFIPAAAKALHIFNVNNQTMERVDLPKVDKKKYSFYNSKNKFIDAIFKDGCLWLIPATYPGIIKMNLTDESMTIFDKWIPENGYFFRARPYIEDNFFIIPDGISKLVLKFDMENGHANIFRVGKSNNGVMKFCKRNDDFFFAPRLRGSIVKWNYKTGDIKEYDIYPDGFIVGQIVFSNCFMIEDKVYFSPADSNFGIVLENDTLKEDDSITWKTKKYNKIQLLFQTEEELYYREDRGHEESRVFLVNKSNKKVTNMEFYLNNLENYKNKIMDNAFMKGRIITESDTIQLKDFLSSLERWG